MSMPKLDSDDKLRGFYIVQAFLKRVVFNNCMTQKYPKLVCSLSYFLVVDNSKHKSHSMFDYPWAKALRLLVLC